jgi:hypothetical protein
VVHPPFSAVPATFRRSCRSNVGADSTSIRRISRFDGSLDSTDLSIRRVSIRGSLDSTDLADPADARIRGIGPAADCRAGRALRVDRSRDAGGRSSATTGSLPALSLPALSLPALSLPALSLPALSLDAALSEQAVER